MKTNIIPFARSESETIHLTATVKGMAKDSVLVQTPGGVINAGVAFSCLVSPAAGDKVLLSQSDLGSHVLAILERPDDPDMEVELPGSLRIKAVGGSMDLVTGKSLNLTSAEKTRMVSKNIQISGRDMSLDTDTVITRARRMESYATSVKLFTKSIDTIADRITQRVVTLMRWVEGVETLSIGNLIRRVKNTMVHHSKDAIITAEKDVRIDAKRIHMG